MTVKWIAGLALLTFCMRNVNAQEQFGSCFPDTLGRSVKIAAYVGADASEKVATLQPADEDYQLVSFQPPPIFGFNLPAQYWRTQHRPDPISSINPTATPDNRNIQLWQHVQVNATSLVRFCISALGAYHGSVVTTAPCVNHPSQYFNIDCQYCNGNRPGQNCTLQIQQPESLCFSFQRGPLAALARWEKCDGNQMVRYGRY